MTEYKKKLFEILGDDTFGICPAPMTSDIAFYVIDRLAKEMVGDEE